MLRKEEVASFSQIKLISKSTGILNLILGNLHARYCLLTPRLLTATRPPASQTRLDTCAKSPAMH